MSPSSLATQFPPGFVFGAATAAYQIEGAVSEGGRTPSIWDVFSHTPGRTLDGDTGDRATDHYHRYGEDLALMQSLNLDAYRFSISWSRVQPNGTGALNPEGVDFYERLVDGLLERGIAPVATLYHWDLPQSLQVGGGWLSRETTERFRDYAQAIASVLGDRVDTWTTLNEPWCSAYLGHGSGEHAPGISDGAAALRAAHHLNLAHGLAVDALRSTARPDATISITLNLHHISNAPDAGSDVAVRLSAVGNGSFTGPILHGRYPAALLEATRSLTDWSFVEAGDLAQIQQSIDVLGVNYYSSLHAREITGTPTHQQIAAMGAWPGCSDVEFLPPAGPLTAMGWNIDPDAFEDLLVTLHDEAPDVPVLITENGAAFTDVLTDREVHDNDRIEYLDAHLRAVAKAIGRGADVRGYFAWSLLDNFEWALGYAKRFGLVRVDYDTMQRTIKDSGHWYRELIAAHRHTRSSLPSTVRPPTPELRG